jgi:dolichyl-phosphate beta-glucosyltransferase
MVLCIPIYNGAQYVLATMNIIRAWVHAHPGVISALVVVDDGSTDRTYALCQSIGGSVGVPAYVYRHEKNKGKGAALRTAFTHALSFSDVWIGMTDVELPYGMDFFSTLPGTACAARIGVRVGATSTSLRRSYYSRVFHWCIPSRISHVSDTQCGVKLFSRAAVKRIVERSRTSRWVFDVEMLLCAMTVGAVEQVRVSYRVGFVQGRGSVRALRHGPRIVWDMCRIFLRQKTY